MPAIHAVHVLEQERDAAERTLQRVGVVQRLVIPCLHNGVDRGVHRLSPGDGREKHFLGADLAFGYLLGQPQRIVAGVFLVTHGDKRNGDNRMYRRS